jgi:hypothetical protein
MRKKKNIKSEANWSIFRRDFTPGFEDILDHGVNSGWYNVEDPLEQLSPPNFQRQPTDSRSTVLSSGGSQYRGFKLR